MIKGLINILVSVIPNKLLRKKVRAILQTRLFGWKVYKNAKYIGKRFMCGGYSCASKNTYIGDFVRFNGVTIIGGGNVKIGNYCQFAQDTLILAQNHKYDNGTQIPFDDYFDFKDVEIEDFVWIGQRATILPGTKIGEGAIIQAGAVVHGEIPKYAIAGGNPAKVFKYRDTEHFCKLKENKSFYESEY